MEVMKRWVVEARVPLGMLLVQVIATGLQLLSRVILSEGTFIFALMAYRNIVAALTIAPFALYFERGVVRNLTFAAFFWLFMVALTGANSNTGTAVTLFLAFALWVSLGMGLFYYGLKDTTATYATNFLNLIPPVTFLFSTILRVENLGLKTREGKIKILGAMLCLAGALTMALYKGKSFGISDQHQHKIISQSKQNKTRGTIFLVSSVLSYGFWFILQVKLFKVFPYKYWATLLTSIIASVQSTVIGICIDRKPNSWRLGWNLQLVTIFYSGILATAATFCLVSMAITQKGPSYPSMFNPLALILVAIIEALFLREETCVGSLIGMALVIVGLYSFLWGKHKEVKATLPVQKERGGRDEGEGGGRDANGGVVAPESLGQQSSATVVPAASLNSNS